MRKRYILLGALAAGLVIAGGLPWGPEGCLFARRKNQVTPANDPTSKLFQLLDTSYDGKLTDDYVLADVYEDSAHPGQQWQHILRVDYDKKLYFGKFRFVVRSISKPTAAQLKTYTVKELYDFGSDSEEFEKIAAGPFGKTGDMYLRAEGNTPLAAATITPEVKAAYDKYLTEYLIPALEKSKGSG